MPRADISLRDIELARHSLVALRPSPVVSTTIGRREVLLKLENELTTRSFKIRGALHTISSYTRDHRARNFVTASSGNQGVSISYAAKQFGAHATIVVPSVASATKIKMIQQHGGEVRVYGDDVLDSDNYARSLAESGRRAYISSSGTREMVVGYGTIALEIVDQCPNVSTVLVPVSNGGLAGSVAFVLAHIKPTAKVIGVQSANTPAMYNHLYGRQIPEKPSVCDALAGGIDTSALGAILCRDYLERLVLVNEKTILEAMTWIGSTFGLFVEGAAACPVAAVRSGEIPSPKGDVVLVLSGGNVGPLVSA